MQNIIHVSCHFPLCGEADDLMVFLDADIPAGTDVIVYGKLLGVGDTTEPKNRPWTQMIKSAASNSLGAGELVYKFDKNGHDESTVVGGLNSSGVFEYVANGSTFNSIQCVCSEDCDDQCGFLLCSNSKQYACFSTYGIISWMKRKFNVTSLALL